MKDKLIVDVLTGKRGGYGAMRPMLRYLRDNSLFDLSIIVTDQHLDEKFGMTVKEIRGDFDKVIEIPMPPQDGTSLMRIIALKSFGVQLAHYFMGVRRPDILMLYGDRGEVLEAASVATLYNIKIGHMQGGDLSGSVDEHVRHAVTKLSHLHFVSCNESRDRVISLGEDPNSAFVVGDHHIDEICEGRYTDESEVRRRFNLGPVDKPIILLQHSETTTQAAAAEQIGATLTALASSEDPIIAVYPCSDPGFDEIIKALIKASERKERFYLYKNIDAVDFWGLMSIAKTMVGNSSAGIIEARYFNLPVVNIGNRQNNRASPCNVLHSSYSADDITRCLTRALSPDFRTFIKESNDHIYGNGDAGKKTVEILGKSVELIKYSSYLKNFFADK